MMIHFGKYFKTFYFGALVLTLIPFAFCACQSTDTPQASMETTSDVAESTAETNQSTNEDSTKKESSEEKSNKTTAEKTTDESENEEPAPITSLSEDLYSFQLQIEEQIYQFPMTYEAFTQYGWTTSDDMTQVLDPNSYGYATFTKDNLSASIGLFNGNIDSRNFSECSVATFQLKEDILATQVTVTLPNSIVLGTSTKEDVLAAYGDPSETNTDESSSHLIYIKDYYEQVDIQISSQTNVVCGVSIQNILENTKENESEIKKVTDKPTKEVLAYQAPTSIGDDFYSFNLEYDGDYYHIPAPVSEFIKNGWKVDTKSSDDVIKAGSHGWVYLKKHKQTLSAIAENPSDIATTIENCFVTTIKGDDNSTDIPITIAKGITRGMSKADLLVALSGAKMEYDEITAFEYYTLKNGESNNYIEIMVRKDKDIVQAIELNNSTKE